MSTPNTTQTIKCLTVGWLLSLTASCSLVNPADHKPVANLPAAAETWHSATIVSRRNWVISEQASLLVLPLDNTLFPAPLTLRVQQQLRRALAGVFARVDVRDEADNPGGRESYHYLVEAQVLVHEDKLNSIFEVMDSTRHGAIGRDRVSVKVRLYDGHSSELIDTSIVHVRSIGLGLTSSKSDNLFNSAFRRYALQLSALGSPLGK